MWKSLVAIVASVAIAGTAFGHVAQIPAAVEASTRFGSLTVNEDKELLFNGRKVAPAVVGNNSLNLSDPVQIGETDVVLVLDNGGTGCPSMHYFVTVSKAGARATKAFGTCADVISVKRIGDSIRVIMSGFLGPFEPESAQLRAARQRHTFVYRAGAVTKNGKPVK